MSTKTQKNIQGTEDKEDDKRGMNNAYIFSVDICSHMTNIN